MKRPTHKATCGCLKYTDREAFVSMCAPHDAEFKEIHDRWTADHRREQAVLGQETLEAIATSVADPT